MADVGLTDTGLITLSLPDVYQNLQDKAKEIFSDLVPVGDVVNTGANTTQGRMIGVISPSLGDLWEAVQQVDNAFKPSAATKKSLDDLVAYLGLERKKASYSVGVVVCYGVVGTQIPVGRQMFSQSTGKYWQTQTLLELSKENCNGFELTVGSVEASAVYGCSYYLNNNAVASFSYTSSSSPTEEEILTGLLSSISTPNLVASISGGVLVVNAASYTDTLTVYPSSNLSLNKVKKNVGVVALELGDVEAATNTITTIASPVLGWESVTNPAPATVGDVEETDEELRLRFRNSKYATASNSFEALWTAIEAVDGVDSVQIYENDTDEVDELGILPHSFSCVVVGGEDNEVAQAIHSKRPIGIRCLGNTLVTFNDTRGWLRSVKFQRPEYVPVYISLVITADNTFPADGEELIKSSLVSYINNLGVGADVKLSRLYTPINTVSGFEVDSLYVNTTPSPTTSANVIIAYNEIAFSDAANISITVV